MSNTKCQMNVKVQNPNKETKYQPLNFCHLDLGFHLTLGFFNLEFCNHQVFRNLASNEVLLK